MSAESQRGMTSREQWKQTSVHKASKYSCGKCGERFATPHEVYDHLDAEHPPVESSRRKKR